MPKDASTALNEIKDRVKRLEEAIFPPSGGTPTVFESRLAKIERDLSNLDLRSEKKWKEVDQRIRETIRIVAELREALAEKQRLDSARAGRTMTA